MDQYRFDMSKSGELPNDEDCFETILQHRVDDHTPARPLSGPGASRQTRRLQLRNSGFRATALPSRKVTPLSLSSGSTNRRNDKNVAEDAENMSPSEGVNTTPEDHRRNSGVLSEIRNPSISMRPRRQKPRIKMEAGTFNPAMANYGGVYADAPLSSPPMPPSGIRAKSAKTRARMKRRSISTEHSKHIEFLEAELEEAQSQLRAQNSPTVTKQRATHIRSLSTETRQLQDEVDEWEQKFELRLQEMLEPHLETEAEIRSKARSLEDELELSRYRIGELEGQLDVKTINMDSLESANFDLEKRLEMMARLLASSPTKLDLHNVKSSSIDNAGVRRKQMRPKSMLSRFPTVSSLISFPEHQPPIQFALPSHSHLQTTPHSMAATCQQPRLSLDTDFHHSDLSSDAASVFSEAPMTADSMTSEDPSESASGGFTPWTINAAHNARSRPGRRMRRFGAGSLGMKSLILPATSQCEPITSSTRPCRHFERRGTMPSLNLHSRSLSPAGEADSPCSSASRRRASTNADRTTSSTLAMAPFTSPPELSEGKPRSYMCPDSQGSGTTTRRFSSLGSVAGRNLMDELSAARSNRSSPSVGEDHSTSPASSRKDQMTKSTTFESYLSNHSSPNQLTQSSSSSGHETLNRQASEITIQPRKHMTSTTYPNTPAWTQLRIIFGDLWRSPVDIVRHFILTTQTRMRIPGPLRNVQWWLIGVLLGPMARRHMVKRNMDQHCTSPRHLERQALISTSAATSEDMAYGSVYDSPPRSSPDREVISGKGRKRALIGSNAAFSDNAACCAHHASAKHSPWMWLRFSLTLAFAVGVAFKDGPGNLLKAPCVLPTSK